MPRPQLWVPILFIVLWPIYGNQFVAAQGNPEPDPRFEKLAKELYPKVKQEGVPPSTPRRPTQTPASSSPSG